ncbi:hypothetical protein ABT294_02505 [Nonomuraea sp. NPDC000554]|uniref:hypothetical protein n=1 Tax=Nonomuraea sp. NPDC000554 TaxID=3154259 RepID=UPI0033325C86
MSDGIRIEPETLLDAARACEETGNGLRPAVDDFRTSAAPTDDCFGLVERGSQELAESYRDFHAELLAFAEDLTAKLAETATGLRESARSQGGG